MAARDTEKEAEEENRHFQNVISAFQQYAPYALAANNRRLKDIFTLPREDQALIEQLGYKRKLAKVDEAILSNAAFLNLIVANPTIFENGPFEDDGEEEGFEENLDEARDEGQLANWWLSERNESTHGTHAGDGPQPAPQGLSNPHGHLHPHESHFHSSGGHEDATRRRPTNFDMDKVRSTLKQLVRDWSEEGREEREASYRPIREALLEHFSDIPMDERHNFRVLVPGAGLGRLAYDVAKCGFSCQGNEFSHYMLLTSFFILNRTQQVHQHTIYPYVHSLSNLPDRTAMLKCVQIPDVLPSDLPPGSNFSLVAGDFEEVYGQQDGEPDPNEPSAGLWDAVLTCFFIDTAKNIVSYLRIIHRILAPGGIWINLGPLLWHFEENTTSDPSIELDLEEVKVLATRIGFEIKNERTIDTTYVNNKESMLGYVYHAAFWTATKTL
ncbi:N2227-domain-containing protein [Russula earlei]|uniref:N2227-domain-containing protein n=1 Tax=Russula earlei TaxID=71964 RepID=A0ACC0U3P0_9AGAM|nr:N2227-domain-containing protein [Russula earlei]